MKLPQIQINTLHLLAPLFPLKAKATQTFTDNSNDGNLSGGLSLTNNEVTVDIMPIGDGSHGILSRYQNNNKEIKRNLTLTYNSVCC